MQKSALLTRERISRLVLAFLLMLGILLPLLLLFGLGGQVPLALAYGVVTLGLFMACTVRRYRWFVLGGVALFAVIQLLLPGLGFFGGSLEAIKAMALYFNGLVVVMPQFGSQVAALLAVGVAVGAFLFSQKGAGFLPATILVVLVLFGLWALGKGTLVWFTLPALVALLLLVSQTAHEKISLLNVLPMALVVVVVALLLLPTGRVTIPPLEQAATNLRQAITDYLFFTEPRNVFTLGSYGYYPQGGNQLGGAAEPTDYPVMMVKTSRKTLLRAVVKDEYTGRSFRDTSSAKRHLYINPRWASLREKVFLEKLPPEGIRQADTLMDQHAITVQMQNNAASTVFTPLFLRSLSMQSNMVPYFNDSSELFITRDLQLGDRYTVYTPVLEGGDAGLGALVNSAPKQDEYYASIVAQYTQLPEHMEAKTYAEVASLTDNAVSPYDKALAIMSYLRMYFRYTLTPEPYPDNQDFVTYFLHVGKEGYCTYFASAMTVMCRMAGLPSRYVEGFVAYPAADGFAYITGKEAHAWTEVYFEGFGWVPFDPTPAQGQNQQPPQSDTPEDGESEEEPEQAPPDEEEPEDQPEEPEEEPEDPPEEEPEEEPESQPEEQPDMLPENPDNDQPQDPSQQGENENPNMWWLWLLLGMAAAGVALGVRIHLRMPGKVAAKAATQKDQIFIYGNAVAALLRMRGRQPKQGETPLRFARRMDNIRVAAVPILPLWRIMALSNYSQRQPGKEQTARAEEIFQAVYKAQPLFVKARFQLGVAFSSRYYHSLDTQVERQPVQSKTMLPGMGGQGPEESQGRKPKARAVKKPAGKKSAALAQRAGGKGRKPVKGSSKKAPKRARVQRDEKLPVQRRAQQAPKGGKGRPQGRGKGRSPRKP